MPGQRSEQFGATHLPFIVRSGVNAAPIHHIPLMSALVTATISYCLLDDQDDNDDDDDDNEDEDDKLCMIVYI